MFINSKNQQDMCWYVSTAASYDVVLEMPSMYLNTHLHWVTIVRSNWQLIFHGMVGIHNGIFLDAAMNESFSHTVYYVLFVPDLFQFIREII